MDLASAIAPAFAVPASPDSFILPAEALVLTVRTPAAPAHALIARRREADVASNQTTMNESLPRTAAAAISAVEINGADAEENGPEDYAINHWRTHESEAEHAFRVLRAENEAKSLFVRATVKQSRDYEAATACLRGLRAPRDERGCAAALRVWRDTTQNARTLYIRTCDTLMRTGEISDDLDRAWTELIDPGRARKLWG